MKCDTCIHKHFHPGGSWQSVAEGGDDPYPYHYCGKDHWVGEGDIDEDQVNMPDPWIDCVDYVKLEES